MRKSLGDGIANDLRFVVRRLVGEENFVEMHPNRSNNYCCGGGGGALQGGFPEARRRYGRLKAEQIKATGAGLCVVCCHNCEDGIRDCIAEWGLDVKVMLMSEYIAEAIDLPEVEE